MSEKTDEVVNAELASLPTDFDPTTIHVKWPAVVTPVLRFVKRNGVKILQQQWIRGPELYWEDVPMEEET